VKFVDEAKPYFAVTLAKQQKSAELMQEVVEILGKYDSK